MSTTDLPGRALIDLDAIASNTRELRRRAGAAQVMAVVKANAYGHGMVPVAKASLAAGATWLGAAQLTEALALRAGLGPTYADVPILSWIYAADADFAPALAAHLDLGVSSVVALESIAAAARASGTTARVHLKLDTGLGRAGSTSDTWEALVRRALDLEAEGAVRAVGMWSHFAYADDPTHPTVAAQAQAFKDGLALSESLGANFEVRHLANSAALVSGLDVAYDLVRPGLALYGLSPIPDRATSAQLGLTPAMTLDATLSLVKNLPKGHGVSYGHTYHTPSDTVTGIVPLGYADGIFRSASGVGPVQVGDRRLSVAGRVCMDQFVVDLGPGAGERAGDRVTLFGPGTHGEPTAQDWADAAGTISYEIVTRIPAHIPRVYVGGDA